MLAVVLTLTALAPLFDNLAQATLGAVVIVAALSLVDVDAVRRLVRWQEMAVAGLERHQVAAGITGGSTAKVTALHGLRL